MDYRRMGILELSLDNTTSSHHLRDMWESPRWTVIRIQALTLLSIILSFLLANFGSCRRWSNRWLVQKGFFAAHVLSLSLRTYSIGLMQSSSVKSEMYPIWTVSLFTLFGCIDPVTDYIGLDYKGPLSKVVYGICLNCGYVLLMTISTISSVVGNTAIGMLSGITFIKGFHRSLALMQHRRIRNTLNSLIRDDTFVVDRIRDVTRRTRDELTLAGIEYVLEEYEGVHQRELRSCYDVCVAYALSHQLQGYFLGERDAVPDPRVLKRVIMKFDGYNCFFKVIETELAFMYEVFFTGNPFLHYYQAKAASLWAVASLMGICFVGVAAAIPGTMSSHSSGSTKVVDTTTADLVITSGILVHLIRCWTSNWAKVAVACAYARQSGFADRGCWWTWWMRLKTFVATSTNWFDKYLWQDQIGQYSMTTARNRWARYFMPQIICFLFYVANRQESISEECLFIRIMAKLYRGSARLANMLGLDYISEMLWDLLGSDTGKTTSVRLEDDVKASIIKFLEQIETNRLEGNWLNFSNYPSIKEFLPYCKDPKEEQESRDDIYTSCVIMWHIATRSCGLVEEIRKLAGAGAGAEQNSNRRVAIALSNYCAYLLVSAPELLPGLASNTKRMCEEFRTDCRYGDMMFRSDSENVARLLLGVPTYQRVIPGTAVLADPWETLALVWVRLLVYAAPYGNKEAHMRHLARGGELITHLWAFLYHLNFREWQHPDPEKEDIHNNIFQKEEKKNLLNITTVDDAEMITMDDLAVISFVESLSGPYCDELATASKLEDGVRFFQTSSPDVARLFHIDPEAGQPALVLLNKEANEKFTLYDGSFRAYDIAYFVTSNKRAFAKTRTQGTASSSVDNPIKKQSSEDEQTEDEIAKESSGDESHGQTKDEIVEVEILPLS